MVERDIVRPRLTLQGLRPSPTRTVLPPRFRLLMVLHWLRTNTRLKELGSLYGVSSGTVSREIKHILPKLYVRLHSLNLIHWPEQWTIHPFESVVAAIDCTTHYRCRVHPRQADYYRADKHAFFLTAQVVVGLSGIIYSVHLGLGHNNDKGMLKLTGLKDFLLRHNVKFLADRGYSHPNLVTPDERRSKEWNNTQKGLRSVVETVQGLAQNWGVARERFVMSPELQEVALMIVYYFLQMRLQEYPLRP